MSKYADLQSLTEGEFRRLTGVKPATFTKMIEVLEHYLLTTKRVAGRPARLCPADQLLMMLEYHREYRTYFHIATSYGLTESNAYRAIRRAEDALIKSGVFRLPGRKALLTPGPGEVVVIVDATESAIQRPKKSSVATTQLRKSTITSKRR